jgi:hypothetical protein
MKSHSNEATPGSGVFCGSVATATSYCNIAVARKGVFCWVRPEAISRGPTGQSSQSGLRHERGWELVGMLHKILIAFSDLKETCVEQSGFYGFYLT